MLDPADTPKHLAIRMAHWLLENQDSHGRIFDPLHLEHGTYADGFAALVFALMHRRERKVCWVEAMHRSLAVAQARPINSEFDQLALLLLSARLGLDLAIPLYSGNRLVSNNWVAMRALNYSLRSKLRASEADRCIARQLWRKVLSWQQQDGLFVDSPGGSATPLTYHAKFCALIALALAEAEPDFASDLRVALLRGLDALAALVSPGGVLVPYGRSRHTLFGYAAALLALGWASTVLGTEWGPPAQRLLLRLRSFVCPDGHIPCVLGPGESEKRDWDTYINNPDYNAYAAALLLLTPDLPKSELNFPIRELTCLEALLTWRRGDWFLALATQGASVPRGTPFFCDHRYYGMQPLWVENKGVPVFVPPVYHWGERESLVDPAASPWIPYLQTSDGRYCCRTYRPAVVESLGDRLVVEATGTPECYRAVPRWRRGLNRMLTKTASVYAVQPLQTVDLVRRLTWEPGLLESSCRWSGRLPAGCFEMAKSESWCSLRQKESPVLKSSKIAVVIPSGSSERESTLLRLIEDIHTQSVRPVELEVVRGVSPSGRARNLGVERTQAEVIIFLDDDVRLGGVDVFEKLLSALDVPGVGLVGTSQLLPLDSSAFQRACADQISRSQSPIVEVLTDSDMVTTACCAIRRATLVELGGFHERIMRGVDPELRHRVRSAGYRIVVAPRAWHYHPVPSCLWELLKIAWRNGHASAFAQRNFPETVLFNPDGHVSKFEARVSLPKRIFGRARGLVRRVFEKAWYGLLYDLAYALGYVSSLLTHSSLA